MIGKLKYYGFRSNNFLSVKQISMVNFEGGFSSPCLVRYGITQKLVIDYY